MSSFSCSRTPVVILDGNAQAAAARAEMTIDSATTSADQVQISGTLLDLESEEPLIYAAVVIYQKDELVTGVETDFTGNFSATIPTSGLVELEFWLEMFYLGYRSLRVDEFHARAGQRIHIRAMMTQAYDQDCGQGWRYTVPLIQVDEMGSGQTFTSGQIRRSPTRG